MCQDGAQSAEAVLTVRRVNDHEGETCLYCEFSV